MTIKEVKEKDIDKFDVKEVIFLYTNYKRENKRKTIPVEDFLKGDLKENYPSLDNASFTVRREECPSDDGEGVAFIKACNQLMISLPLEEKNAFDYEKTIKAIRDENKDTLIEREDYWNGAMYIAEFYKRPWDYRLLLPTIFKSFGEKDTYFKGVRFPFGTPLQAKYYALALPREAEPFAELLDEVVVEAYQELVELAKTHPENLKTMTKDELDNLLERIIEDGWDWSSLLPLISDAYGTEDEDEDEDDFPSPNDVFTDLREDFIKIFYNERTEPALDGLDVSHFKPTKKSLSVLDCFRSFDKEVLSKYPTGAIVEITIKVNADAAPSIFMELVTKYDFRLGSSIPVEDFIEYAQKGGKEACWTLDLEKH